MRLRFKLRKLSAVVVALSLMVAPLSAGAKQNPVKIVDNELVIANLNDNSEIAGIKVLNQIRVFGQGMVDIEDTSKYQLTSARNLYSTDKIVAKDNSLKLKTSIPKQNNYSDVYYLAEVDKKEINRINMPVKVKVEYFLDGKQIAPSKLSGKSGHLKIVCCLENTTGAKKELEFTDSTGNIIKKEAEIYTPYVVSLSGWEFDNRKFSNISAPGVDEKSPEGVVVNVQGVTQVSWTVPLIPPKYPASQYTVLEADGKDIELPSFNIGVIPIVPTTAEIDTLTTVENSFKMLYDGFAKIEDGVGEPSKDQTLLFGLNALGDGLNQISGGLGTLKDNLKQVRFGLQSPNFNAATYNTARGIDAGGSTPGVKDAVGILKTNVDEKFIPAFAAQKQVLSVLQTAIGTPADNGEPPSLSTSLYNDVNILKGAVAGTPAEFLITAAIEPKLLAIGKNVEVFKNGGELITASGSIPFPANISALEAGAGDMSAALGKVDQGLTVMVAGIGQVDRNGQPVKVMSNGKPGSLLYALDYLQEAVNGQMIPGIVKLQDGTGQIGSGAGEAKEAIAQGLQTFESRGAIVAALEASANQTDTFLGKPKGAEGTVAYVFQTPEVSKEAKAMYFGLGIIGIALLILIALGRPSKQVSVAPAAKQAQEQ